MLISLYEKFKNSRQEICSEYYLNLNWTENEENSLTNIFFFKLNMVFSLSFTRTDPKTVHVWCLKNFEECWTCPEILKNFPTVLETAWDNVLALSATWMILPVVIWQTKRRHHCVLVDVGEDDGQADKPHLRSWHVWFRKQEKGDSLGDWSDLLSAHTADDQKVTDWTNLLTESQLDERAKRAIALNLRIAKIRKCVCVTKEIKVADRNIALRLRSGLSSSWIYLSTLLLYPNKLSFGCASICPW